MLDYGFIVSLNYYSTMKFLQKTVCSRLVGTKCFSSAVPNEEYTATPQYPPILDLSFKKKIERRKEGKHKDIEAVKTVEEKQIKLNMPRYYGFKSYLIREDTITYNSLSFAQHLTRTHLISNNNLPDYYKNLMVDEQVASLKSDIEEAILIELEGYKRKHDLTGNKLDEQKTEDLLSSFITQQVNRIIINKIGKSYPHLTNSQVDYDPRVEATWCVGGMNPPRHIKLCKKGRKWMEPYVEDPVDRVMVYFGTPTLSLRFKDPLPLIMAPSEAENPDLEVPFFKYDPRVVGTVCTHRHMANTPGVWPGDSNQFGLMSYHKRGHFLTRSCLGFKDTQEHQEALHRQGIFASFCWLHAQANNLGFTTYNDLTYPLVTQTVITNGKTWSFYVYQLNTTLLHSKYIYENPKKNICWATNELNLFENIDGGKLIGFNDDVLKLLVKFYANTPQQRLGINLQPYLSADTKVSADYEDDDKREWLEREYKFLMSNCPRVKKFPEIYAWEKIYKIDHKTRFMDKRRTPFDFLEKPQRRKLDDRQAIYVPRAHRPHLPRHKGRYKKEYFP